MPEPTSPPLGRRYATLVVSAVSLLALTCVAFLVPVPYVTMRPGPAFDTLGTFGEEQMFTFGDGVKTYPTDGALDFTTVSVTRSSGRLSLGEAMAAYFTDDVSVVPRTLIYPEGSSDEQSRSQGQAQLTSSKDSSRAAALRAAGYEVPEVPRVAEVMDDGAAAGVLEPDDLIREVDGEAVEASDAVVAAIAQGEPGDIVTLGITRDGEDRDVEITTRPAADDPSVPRIGITIATDYRFPVEIENNVGDEVGGPSAGSMFALAIYDQLTPGSLTGGQRIAGTGEMAADGTVGPIGGIRQKMAGAAQDGAAIFLVPEANCAEALQGDDRGMRLLSIATLEDAIDSLETLAEDPDAEVATCR